MENQPTANGFGSLQKGIDGDFNFVISDILGEAWELAKGHRLRLLAAGAIYFVLSLISNAISTAISAAGAGEEINTLFIVIGTVVPLLVGILTYPLMAGILLYGITHAAGRPVSFDIFLSCYNRTFTIFGTMLLTVILAGIGFLLLVIPGIYLNVAYGLAIPLLVEKNLGVWEALEGSRKAITHCWFRYFGFLMVIGLIVAVSAIPLLIGLFWTMPFAVMAMGVAYREIFGFEGA